MLTNLASKTHHGTATPNPCMDARLLATDSSAPQYHFGCGKARKTVWPSGLRRWLKAPVRKGVGSNPTAVTLDGRVNNLHLHWVFAACHPHVSCAALHAKSPCKKQPIVAYERVLERGINLCVRAARTRETRPYCACCSGQLPYFIAWITFGGPVVRTVWPSGLRRWLQAPVRKGVGSNPTAVTL